MRYLFLVHGDARVMNSMPFQRLEGAGAAATTTADGLAATLEPKFACGALQISSFPSAHHDQP
eukprot:64636-Chlamydomonas_euryale.AAC.6